MYIYYFVYIYFSDIAIIAINCHVSMYFPSIDSRFFVIRNHRYTGIYFGITDYYINLYNWCFINCGHYVGIYICC